MTSSDWKKRAYEAVVQVAETMEEFTPDDVWRTGLDKPIEGRALGNVMRSARQNGLIAKTGRSQPTTQPESHGTDVTIWRSLIFPKKHT